MRSRYLSALALAVVVSVPAVPAVAQPDDSPAPGELPGVISSDRVTVSADAPRQVVYKPVLGQGEVGWMPWVYAFDSGTAAAPTRPVYLHITTHRDFAPPDDGKQIYSRNAGSTFSPQPTAPGIDAAARAADGRIVEFTTTNGKQWSTPVMPSRQLAWTRTSADNGATWTPKAQSTVDITPERWSGPTAHVYPNNMVAGPDGVLYLSAYAVLANPDGAALTSMLLRSVDAGVNWTLHSIIARGSPTVDKRQYSEAGIALTADGSLLAVIRTCKNVINPDNNARGCDYEPMQTTRLSNVGDPAARWSELRFIDAPGFPAMINPRMQLLTNGILVLLAGRPDTWITVSADGLGNSWTNPTLIYRNEALDRDGNPLPYPQNFGEGSSGNSGFAAVEANRLVAAADSCHMLDTGALLTDKCQWRSQEYTMSDLQEPAIVRRLVDVLTPGAGKLDLTGKVRAKAVTVSVDNEYTNPARPRLGAAGAVDGSVETWSAAAAAGGPGVYTLALDKEYRLSKIGLSQWIGRRQSARVEVATTPQGPWRAWWDAGEQTSYALRYSPPTLPVVSARYVRITTPGSPDCPAGMTAPCSMLNEVELYAADTQTFENDPLYGRPRDYQSSTTGVLTTDQNTVSGHRVLQLMKNKAGTSVLVRKMSSPAATKHFEFRFKVGTWPNEYNYDFDDQVPDDMFVFSILGQNGRKAVQPYRFGIFDDGSIRHYHGSARRWVVVAPAGTVASGQPLRAGGWKTIGVDATASGAVVMVDGRRVGTVQPDTRFATLDGHLFSTDPNPLIDDQRFHVDDIEFRSMS